MKNVREYYIQCFDSEAPTFIRVMKAVPPDQAAYTPHPRSTAAGDLVWLLAAELHDACELIDSGEVDYIQKPAPGVRRIDCRIREKCRRSQDAACEGGRREMGQPGALEDGRQSHVGSTARRHAVRFPPRRRAPPRSAFQLPAADGRKGAVDLRPVGRRSRHVNSTSSSGEDFREGH